jgi:hypothetical protein
MTKIDRGEIKKIENKKPRVGANADYFFTILEREGVDKEFMFTKLELDRAKYRAVKNPEDWIQRRSFLSRLFRAMKKPK